MKKALLVLAILVVLAIGGLAVFIATFDADRYRPLVVKELQKVLGRPVTIERISLAWRNGIAARLKGVVLPDAVPGAEPLLALDEASATVRLWPLLHRDVQIIAVTLSHPHIHIARDAQGQVNLLGLAAAGAPAAAPRQPAGAIEAPVSLNIDSVRLEDGAVHWTDAMAQPVAELRVTALNVTVRHIAPGRPMDVEMQAAVGSASRNVSCKGRVLLPATGEAGSVRDAEVSIDRLALAALLPPAQPGEPSPRATLTTRMALELPTLDQAEAVPRLSAQGTIKLTDLTIENLNILRAVFDKLSMLPGLVQRLEARLPEGYQEKLAVRDTAFAPVEVPVKVEGGVLTFEPLELRTDTVRLVGQGQVGLLDQSIVMRAVLHIEPQLSAAIIDSVAELGALADASGEIAIPVAIQGRAPQIAVVPDLNYVASKVVVNKVVDALERYLRPKTDEGSAEAPADASAAPQAAPTTEDLVGSLLQRALRKRLPQDTTPQ